MRILYLTFFYEPDLSAGSFRNTALSKVLSQDLGNDAIIDLMTTQPNRYSTYKLDAPAFESRGNMNIHRITLPLHKNGFADQINAFKTYYAAVQKLAKRNKYDLIYATSSKLFTAYLASTIAKKQKAKLYLDIRDIFLESLENALPNGMTRGFITPWLKHVEKSTFNAADHINVVSEGFLPYFQNFKCKSYSTFTNGIDDIFLGWEDEEESPTIGRKTIFYGGNIGKSQALHKIIPVAAELLGDEYEFVIVGDGGIKQKLLDEIEYKDLKNVIVKKPVKREELIKYYKKSDFLFLHLESHPAFEKVIPSKVFELGATNKPIIAGVTGYPLQFITENISNILTFTPCNGLEMVNCIKSYEYKKEFRKDFIAKYSRQNINIEMSKSIQKILK